MIAQFYEVSPNTFLAVEKLKLVLIFTVFCALLGNPFTFTSLALSFDKSGSHRASTVKAKNY